MKSQSQFKYSNSVILYPVLILFSVWLVFWYQVRFNYGIKFYGIRPQKLEGLVGIITSPFLHADIQHLYHNSIPLLVLTLALFYFYKNIAWKVLFFGILLSGLLTWCIGRGGNHIGASGLVYVLVSFIFFKGILAKHFRLIALSLLVVFLYGGMIWYVFPVKEGMSWEGHLSGLLVGLFFALFFRKHVAKPKRYAWEEDDYNDADDPFLKHFDADGNFIEHAESSEHLESTENAQPQNTTNANYSSVNYSVKTDIKNEV